MGRTLDDMIATLPTARQAGVRRRAEEFIREELSLWDLRNRLELRQTDVARRRWKGTVRIAVGMVNRPKSRLR